MTMIVNSAHSIRPPFSVKLWEPDEDDSPYDSQFHPAPSRPQEDLSVMGQMTLREVYTKYYLEDNKHKAPSTLEAYTNALGHWERLIRSNPRYGRNPQLYEIDDTLLRSFQESIDKSRATANKWFRHLRALLNLMGPRNLSRKKSRNNRCYFNEVPLLEDLPPFKPGEPGAPRKPVRMPDNQINLIYESCDAVKWRTPEWWRACIVLMVTYGMRRNEWLTLETTAFDWTTGAFQYYAPKSRKTLHLIVNDVVTAHLNQLTSYGGQYFRPTKSHKQLYETWKKIQDRAGVQTKYGDHYTFHDMRRTCAVRYHEHAPGTAQLLLGHSAPSNEKTTNDYYLGEHIMAPVHKAIRSLKPPVSFLTPLQTIDQQGRLFK